MCGLKNLICICILIMTHLKSFRGVRSREKVARLICDVYTVDGKPFQGDPRNVLKRAIQEAADMGYVFDVGPECEFLLIPY